MRRIYRRMTWT